MSKVLFLDIETAPKVAHVWGLWKQNVGLNQIIQDMFVLNWTAKWLGEEYLYSDSLHYHDLYFSEPENDSIILKSIWDMLDQADYVVAHNGKKFDVPTLNSRFIQHGMKPPSSYQVIDTLAIAKGYFRFTSNKLEFLAKALDVGAKIDTGGFELWSDIVLKHDLDAFDKMVEYCEHDTVLLEQVYLKLRAWWPSHPKLNLDGDLDKMTCNVCGSHRVYKNGIRSTKVNTYQRYRCEDCGTSMRSRYAAKRSKDQKKNILVGC